MILKIYLVVAACFFLWSVATKGLSFVVTDLECHIDILNQEIGFSYILGDGIYFLTHTIASIVTAVILSAIGSCLWPVVIAVNVSKKLVLQARE